METENVYYVHGIDFNEPEDRNLVVGYFSSLELAKAAVGEFVRDSYEIDPEHLIWSQQSGKSPHTPYLVLSAADDENGENFNIFVEKFPLNKRL